MKNILNRITIGSIEDVAESEKVEYLGKGSLKIRFEGWTKPSIGHPFPITQSRFFFSIPLKDGERCRNSHIIEYGFNYLEALKKMNDFLAKEKYYLTHAKYKEDSSWLTYTKHKEDSSYKGCWKLSGRFYEEKKI